MIRDNWRLTRREFLTTSWGILWSALLAGCLPATLRNVPAAVPTLGINTQIPLPADNIANTAIAPSLAPGLAPANTDVAPGLAPAYTPTFELQPVLTPTAAWELSLSKRAELAADPSLFMDYQGENKIKIMTFQFDDEQYEGEPREITRKNACGPAVLATIAKLLAYLKTGIVPDITIADNYNNLDNKSFTDNRGFTNKYIAWDNEMSLDGFGAAAQYLFPKYIARTEFLTPDYGDRYKRIVPLSEWPAAFVKMHKICENGGLIIIEGKKHRGGHILLATGAKEDGTVTIIDTYTGIAESNVLLKNFLELEVDGQAPSLGEQPGLLIVSAIIPKINP